MRLRVACLNVNGGLGVNEFISSGRAQGIARVIAGRQVDLAAFQEFPFAAPSTHSSSVRLFMRALQMPHVETFGLLASASVEGEQVGLVTFSRYPLVDDMRVDFPAPARAIDVADQGAHTPDLHRKGALVCTVEASAAVVMANVHGIPFHRFGIGEGETIQDYWLKVGHLLSRAGFEPPLMIVGDFNAGDRSGLRLAIGGRVSDLFQGRSTRLDGRESDSILVASLQGADAAVISVAPHSDHELLVATVESAGS